MGGTQEWNGGAVASQEAIKELGTNGGGYFNANSAHPFENPNPLSNLFEIFLILLIPFALTRTFGRMVGSLKQGYAILGAMAVIWIGFSALMMWTEFAHRGPAFEIAGGAMEGKETRFGIAGSSIFAVATTLTSTGAVNSFHSSYTGFGGGIAIGHGLARKVRKGATGSVVAWVRERGGRVPEDAAALTDKIAGPAAPRCWWPWRTPPAPGSWE
ncbi:Potassium-transporting ATPase potassium-binding subunit [Streptomyces cyaneofuscatus]